MYNLTFSKILIFIILIVFVVGGISAWRYWQIERGKPETLEEKALKVCNKIIEKGEKKNCIAQVLGDKSICLDIASAQEEEELEPIVDTEAECLFALAYQKGNPNICDEIKTGKKTICYAWLAGVVQDESLCEKLMGGDRKDLCFRKVAFSKSSMELCNKIESEDRKHTCKALIQNNLSLCDAIDNQAEKGTCIAGISQIRNDISLCDKIGDDIGKISCIGYLVAQSKDKSICEEKKELYEKISLTKDFSCFAVTTRDPDLCDKAESACKEKQPELICSDVKYSCLLNIATDIAGKSFPVGRVY